MFEDLYDAFTRLFSFSWPTANGEVFDVEIESLPDGEGGEKLRLCVIYNFYVGDDGPYTGESFWHIPGMGRGAMKRLETAKQAMELKHTVPVRYRRDDPSQNRLDSDAWRGI